MPTKATCSDKVTFIRNGGRESSAINLRVCNSTHYIILDSCFTLLSLSFLTWKLLLQAPLGGDCGGLGETRLTGHDMDGPHGHKEDGMKDPTSLWCQTPS